MNRRQFISNSMAMVAGAALLMDYPAFAKMIDEKGLPKIKIGILSDIHIVDYEGADTFRHALEYFSSNSVDGVIIAGDMADHGLERELKVVADVWFSVFPKNKRPDGNRVEPLFIYGNHDVSNWDGVRKTFPSDSEFEKEAIYTHREKAWKNCFNENFEPVYMKSIKGYNFIGAHWQDNHIDGLAEFIQKRYAVLSGSKPFFYFQHPHPKNTCNGPWAWGQDDGTTTEILSHYPNCVAFSGHSHSPLTEEWDLWQESFVSIGTASLRYIFLIGGRENSYIDGAESEYSEMKRINPGDGRHGMIMSVFDDCIAFEKREFVYDEPLGENWVIPLGKDAGLLSFDNRAKSAQVPQFNPEDKVYVTRAEGEDRSGNRHNQVTVHFPSILKKTHGVRAFDYEVKIEARLFDIVKDDISKRVFSPKCYLGEGHDMEEVTCVFAENQLPLNYEVRFVVRPCECFGGKGKPIYSEWIPARKK